MNLLKDKKAFLFDLDGVLINSYHCWFHLVSEGLGIVGKGPLTLEEFDRSWGQGLEADQKQFFPMWSVDQVQDFYNRNFHKHVHHVREEPGAREVLKELQSRKRKIGVASNSPAPVVQLLLEQGGLTRYLQAVAGADQVRACKPAPDLILHLLQRLSVQKEDACYVGDSIFDEKAARAAGVFFVGYKRPGDLSISNLLALIS